MNEAQVQEIVDLARDYAVNLGTPDMQPASKILHTLEAKLRALQVREDDAPIDMILLCPACHLQHIDAPDEGPGCSGWDNPPHKSHLCHGCGCQWRPADVPTNGVARIHSKNANDNWPR